ncbi:hypothetical protein ACWIUD_07475 [Helicobacter sp. 23-1044]
MIFFAKTQNLARFSQNPPQILRIARKSQNFGVDSAKITLPHILLFIIFSHGGGIFKSKCG